MPVQALSKGVRISPRKLGVVAGLVRGRSVADALVILEHTPRQSAIVVRKAILSAQANADHNHNYKSDTLRITEIYVTPGVRYKRYFAAARGSARPFERKTSHLRVVVDGDKRAPKKPAAKKETK